jgi:predicted GH43/DUF377 family glycosyl hydrolase
MPDIAIRLEENPILRPADVKPSRDGLLVECLLNPGAFQYKGRIGLLLRVAERPVQSIGAVSVPVIDPNDPSGISILEFNESDSDFVYNDPRTFKYRGATYLTTLSHLRLAWSDDGVRFQADESPTLIGGGPLESFGIEDARVAEIDGVYYITYTQVSPNGIGVGLITTGDWQTFHRHGMILPPSNKDCALFAGKINGEFAAFHRPSDVYLGGHYLWLSYSPDATHWGRHACVAKTRPNMWDSRRIGAGAAPIKTEQGWLEIYHGANSDQRYCLGAMLFDLNDPAKLLARSIDPIMEPSAPYELTGFFGNVVFTNGHIANGDKVTVYYGASDEIVCGAGFSIQEILSTLPR